MSAEQRVPEPAPRTADVPDVTLDVAGIARYLGKSTETIRRWARTRGLPLHYVTFNSGYALRSEIDAWIKAQSTPAQVAPPAPVPQLPRRSRKIIRFTDRKR